MLELGADADERTAGIERSAQELEQRRAVLEDLEQPPVRRELVLAHIVEKARGSADIEAPLVVGRAREGGAQGAEELALLRRQPWVGEPLAQYGRAERQPGDSVVEVLARPRGEAGIDRPLERGDALRHPPSRCDDD